MAIRRVILVTPLKGEALSSVAAAFGSAQVLALKSREELMAFRFDRDDVLVTYGTGVIVPNCVLSSRSRPSYNFHPASPHYPGFEPHHFAIREGAREFGATAHELALPVDSGPIVAIEMFDIPNGCAPLELLSLAASAMYRLVQRIGPLIASGTPLRHLPDVTWTGRRIRKKDHAQLQVAADSSVGPTPENR